MNEYFWVVAGLCAFIALLSFKPSEPYLSEFLICNYDTQLSLCADHSSQSSCDDNFPCQYSGSSCGVTPCYNVSSADCGGTSTPYCAANGQSCEDAVCYKSFSESQVNNQIYPWSTYSYLLFLVTMGPLTEVFSYKFAILVGIMGRVATRILLLYGTTLYQMQVMQVTYAFGTAAEDLFSAYIYTVVPLEMYQSTTSYVKTSALLSCIISGVLGDILVTQCDTSLYTLTVISAVFVITGAALGFIVIRNPKPPSQLEGSFDGEKGAEPLKSEPSKHNPAPLQAAREWLSSTWASANWTQTMRYLGEKYHILFLQLQFTFRVVAQRDIRVLTVFWIVGNGVYTILYGYEVSIYSELNQSDNWNGTVLAVMLLAGCLGAMLPVWMKLDAPPGEDTTGLASNSDSREERGDDSGPLMLPRVSVATRDASLVVMNVISCGSLVVFSLSWELYASVAALVVFFAAWQFINVVFYARVATCVNESAGAYTQLVREFRRIPDTAGGIVTDPDADRNLPRRAVSNPLLQPENSAAVFGISSALLSSCPDGDETSLQSPSDSDHERGLRSSEPSEQSQTVEELPPYSVSIIFLITTSVLFQVIVQIVLFSSLQLSLYAVSVILMLLFCIFSAVFILDIMRVHCLNFSGRTSVSNT